jgi:hypothetical protein
MLRPTRRCLPCLTLVGAAALLGAVAAWANGGGYSYGTPRVGALGPFEPSGLQQVEMRTEHLAIDLHLEEARVEVEYVLHNPGAEVTVEAGFPCAAQRDEGEGESAGGPKDPVPPLRDFAVAADGRELPVRVVRDPQSLKRLPRPLATEVSEVPVEIPFWYVFKLTLGHGQTSTLRVRYRTDYTGAVSYVSDDEQASARQLTYLFSSAALWKGPIQQGEVVIRAVSVDPDQVAFNLARRFVRQTDSWTWRFQDLEPTLADDLRIVVGSEGEAYWRPDPVASPGREAALDTAFVKSEGRWELRQRRFRVRATSSLDASHAAEHAADGDRATAWCEGVPGDGVGQTLTLTLDRPRPVTRIGLVNGLARSRELYDKNGRVTRLEVAVDGGRPTVFSVPDEFLAREMCFLRLPPRSSPLSELTLTIREVQPGSRYRDTCLSEIVLVTPLERPPEIQHAR